MAEERTGKSIGQVLLDAGLELVERAKQVKQLEEALELTFTKEEIINGLGEYLSQMTADAPGAYWVTRKDIKQYFYQLKRQ